MQELHSALGLSFWVAGVSRARALVSITAGEGAQHRVPWGAGTWGGAARGTRWAPLPCAAGKAERGHLNVERIAHSLFHSLLPLGFYKI